MSFYTNNPQLFTINTNSKQLKKVQKLKYIKC